MGRKLVCLALFLVIGMSFPGVGFGADKTFKWKYVSVVSEAFPSGKITAEHLRNIEKRTNGRLKIDFVTFSETPYKANEALRLVRQGLVEGLEMINGYNTGDAPLLGAVELPFLLPRLILNLNEYYAIYDKIWNDPGVKKVLQGIWDRFHAVPLGQYYWGPGVISTRKGKEIKGPADLKGLQIREYSAEGADMLKAIGATAAVLTGPEVYTALQRGMCDGVLCAAEILRLFKWYEVLKYMYVCNIKGASSFALFNKEKVAQLPEDLKKVLMEEMAAAGKAINKNLIENNPVEVKWLEEDQGWTINVPSQQDYTYMRDLTKKEAWPKWVDRVGPQGKAMLDICLKAVGDK